MGKPNDPSAVGRFLVVIDTSYSLDEILNRGIEQSVTYRDLNGYFNHVLSINPLARAVQGRRLAVPRSADMKRLGTRHAFVNGAHLASRFALGESAVGGAINFMLSQGLLLRRTIVTARRYPNTVIRGGDPLYAGLFALISARLAGVPLVVRVGSNNERVHADTGSALMPRLIRSRRVERLIERLVLREADFVIGANYDNLKFARRSGAKPARSTVVRYGTLLHPAHFVDPSCRGDSPVDIDPGVALLLYVGRLERVKRPLDLLHVAAVLAERGVRYKFLLAGDGSERSALEDRIHEMGLAEHVFLCGTQTQEWLLRTLVRADVVVSPHTGRALAEAALAAAPVAAYEVDWQGELIEDGVSGRLVPFGDADALAQAVTDLLTDRSAAQAMGLELRNRALSELDPVDLEHREREIYSAVLRRRTRKGSLWQRVFSLRHVW